MQDALRAYMELALGVTEASRRKAEQVVKKLVGQGEARVAQVQGAVEELLATSRANREAYRQAGALRGGAGDDRGGSGHR